MKRKITSLGFFLVTYLAASAASAAGAINTLEKGLFGFSESAIAIRGFDTVAYFTEGKAVEGNPEISLKWSGATWYFSSLKHRDLFAEKPEAYAPAFGGYCAYGVAMGALLKIEGDQWAIVEDRLYLNFDEKWLGEWKKDADNLIIMAEANYPQLVVENIEQFREPN